MITSLINDISKICIKYNKINDIHNLYYEIKNILLELDNQILLKELDNYNFLNTINIDGYNKYIIYSSDIFDIILIKWDKNCQSKIHDHPNKGCLLKILSGKLCEEVYDNKLNIIESNVLSAKLDLAPNRPDGVLSAKLDLVPNRPDGVLQKFDISYRIGNEILHKIIASEDSYSLHIYIPGRYKPIYY
jgi:hypothetical protein